jgi:hypothetical protein
MSEVLLMSVAEGMLTVVKPIPEVGKAMLDEVFGGSEVEPRVDCFNG